MNKAVNCALITETAKGIGRGRNEIEGKFGQGKNCLWLTEDQSKNEGNVGRFQQTLIRYWKLLFTLDNLS